MVKTFLCALLLMPSLAYALVAAEAELVPLSLKVMGGLIIVLGIVLLLYALVKKSGRWLPAGQNREINLIEVRYLAPKKALYLIEVNGSKLLLSGTHERMETLAQWPVESDNPATFERVLSETTEPARRSSHLGE